MTLLSTTPEQAGGTYTGDRPSGYDPAPEERKLIGAIDRRMALKYRWKHPYEVTWLTCHAFLVGQPYAQYNYAWNRLQVPRSTPRYRVRIPINLPMAFFRRTMSRLVSGEPIVFVLPGTSNDEDIRRARAATLLAEHLWEKLRLDQVNRRLVAWALETGTGILKVIWDWGLSKRARDPDDPKDLGASDEDEDSGSSEHSIEAISPYEIMLDPLATDFENARWVIHDRVLALDDVKRAYRDRAPDKVKMLRPSKAPMTNLYQQRLRQLVGVFGSAGGDDLETGQDKGFPLEESIHVIEYWERGTEKHPAGRVAVLAGGMVLHDGPNPYPHGRMPFVAFRECPIAGRFWGQSSLEQALPLFRNINRTRSAEIEILNLCAKPSILEPTYCRVQAPWTNEPGQRIKYTPGPRGEKPEPFVLGNLALPNFTAERANSIQDLQDILSWHESSRGRAPKNLQSGRAVALLQSADESVLGSTVEELQDTWRQALRMILANTRKYYDERRLISVFGSSGAAHTMRLMGTDVVGESPQVDYYNVRVMMGPAWPRDRASRSQEIQLGLQMGILNLQDPKDRVRIRKAFHWVSPEDMTSEFALDENWALEENTKMLQGEQVPPAPHEDHDVHLRTHEQLRKSAEYRASSPEVQAEIDRHIETTEQLQIAVAAKEMAKEAMKQQLAQAMLAQMQGQAQGPQEQGPPPGAAPSSPGPSAPGGISQEPAGLGAAATELEAGVEMGTPA